MSAKRLTEIIDYETSKSIHVKETNTDIMTVLVIVFIAVLVLILFLALPIILRINTETGDYSMRFGGLCSISAITAVDNPGVLLRIGLWRKKWNLTQIRFGGGSTEEDKKAGKESKKGHRSMGSIRRFWNVVKTFKINKFDVMLDTDDYVLNAQLFPLFQFCNNRWGSWHMNFVGNSRLQLEVETRLGRALYAWMRRT